MTLISLVPTLLTCSKRYEGTPIIRLFPILLILPRNSMTGSGCFAAAAAATCFFGFGCCCCWTRTLFTFFSSKGSKLLSCLGLTTPSNASSMSFLISSLERPYFSPKSRNLLTISIDFTNDFLSSSIACRKKNSAVLGCIQDVRISYHLFMAARKECAYSIFRRWSQWQFETIEWSCHLGKRAQYQPFAFALLILRLKCVCRVIS